MVLRKPLLIKFTIKICLIIHINIYKILFFFSVDIFEWESTWLLKKSNTPTTKNKNKSDYQL